MLAGHDGFTIKLISGLAHAQCHDAALAELRTSRIKTRVYILYVIVEFIVYNNYIILNMGPAVYMFAEVSSICVNKLQTTVRDKKTLCLYK